MIYFFSGTGNSQWVAEQLALRTHDTAVFIPQVLNDFQSDISVGADELVGVVFPVYAWAPPAVVMEFLSHVHVDRKAFSYAVCTCGDETGKAFDTLRTVFPFKSAWSLTMPNNYIPLYNLDSPELVREKLGVAEQRLPKIAMDITAHRSVVDVHEGSLAVLKTAVINPAFSLFALTPRRFTVDSTCTGCGTCVHSCPFGTITLADGKPVWNGRCQQCMSCISRCPVHAIQCGNNTRGRGRYVCPDAGKFPVCRESAVPDSSADPAGVEFVAPVKIRSFSNPGVVSRQLLTPENSKTARVTVTEVHIRPGACQERHTHPGSEQIWYALRGKGTALLPDNREHPFTAGDVVRFAENTVHGFRNTGSEEFVYVSVTRL
jgi:quercetin dioxygenase-like cupin family protein/NAD-dependent dihydropyrimidine dehydrogenase PreA subunit